MWSNDGLDLLHLIFVSFCCLVTPQGGALERHQYDVRSIASFATSCKRLLGVRSSTAKLGTRARDHLRAGGVMSVVAMIMIMIAPKVSDPTTGSIIPLELGSVKVAPIPASISPTSPRGIIPKPTASRL